MQNTKTTYKGSILISFSIFLLSTFFIVPQGFSQCANTDVSTIAGTGVGGFMDGAGANAQFNSPRGVAIDGAGNIIVADQVNQRIRKIGNCTDPSIPTLSQWGLIVLSMLMMIFGVVGIQNRTTLKIT